MKQVLICTMLLIAALSYSEVKAYSLLKGQLTDQQGLPVAGGNVVVLQKNKTVASAATSANGWYTIASLNAGTYDVKFSAHGISGLVKNVVLTDGATRTLNYRLTIAKQKNEPAVTHMKTDKRVVRYVEPVPIQEKTAMAEYDMVAASPRASGAVARDYRQQVQYYNPSTESYKKDPENDFRTVQANPLSTLSVDVDRASYSNIRRFINQGQKPPADAVRIEEMINYFDYNYPQPTDRSPVAIITELSDCPWNAQHKLLHIGLQARKISTEKLPPSNLVFLLDVSGSMDEPNKLPLVKSALKLLVGNLRAQDKVSIVVYAGNAGLVLPPTGGDHKTTIIDALDRLNAGGSTAGGAGIELAYKTAAAQFVQGGNNRVILATDGDFNVGVSNDNELEDLITKQRGKGIFLTCLGFGMGNYKDSKMEVLADKGNGNYAYIDNIQEAQKTLVSEFGGTLFTVAKDVKAQIEFNPAKVQGYRLVGYENRLLNNEDFKDDKKDAGDMGSGHSVTILYEIIPAGVNSAALRDVDPLKYQQTEARYTGADELATVKFRYKAPDGDVSKELVHPIADKTVRMNTASEPMRFSASVAMFGMLLKDSKYKGQADYRQTIALAEGARGTDKEGYRAEYIRLVKSVK